jgi:putative glutamine amidotransferase
MKAMRKLKCLALPALLILFTVCGNAPAPGTVTIAILDGSIQSSLLRIGIDVNSDYRDALAKYGAAVVRLSVRDTPEETYRKLSLVSGVLVPGGFDIEPSRYHEAPDKKLEKTDPALDALEFRALSNARDRQLPVLGICRGCQALNVFYGGSLYQDIPSQYRERPPVQHRRSIDLLVYKHAAACYHDVRIEKKSELARLLKAENVRVNTYHHQAARRVAKNFIVSARSTDGVVEGIERIDGNVFILGTQFHPEKMLDEAPAMEEIFRIFVEKAAAWSARQSPQIKTGAVAR